MRYYKKNGENYEEITNAQEIQNAIGNAKENPLPSQYIDEDYDAGGASFQDQQTRSVYNNNYQQQMISYEKNRVFVVPELKELIDRLEDKLKNTDTKRDIGTMLANIRKDVTNVKDFFNNFITAYNTLLDSKNAQPGTIFGKGSTLAADMRQFAERNFSIELSATKESKERAKWKIKDYDLYKVTMNQDIPRKGLEKK